MQFGLFTPSSGQTVHSTTVAIIGHRGAPICTIQLDLIKVKVEAAILTAAAGGETEWAKLSKL